MPEGLPIDHELDLNGSMATYARHVVMFTGQDDWKSRVEEDGEGTGWGDFTRKLKRMTTRGGEYADPFNNIMTTTGSFAPNPPPTSNTNTTTTTTALVFPDALLLPSIPTNDPHDASLRTFIEEYLTGTEAEQEHPGDAVELTQPVVLICGHGGRDQRCGILGPLLKAEFENCFARQLQMPLDASKKEEGGSEEDKDKDDQKIFDPSTPQVGLISHIGGHKFAGNIIIYIPPSYSPSSVGLHPLAGKGIWYGRVEPRHCEGIVRETILNGKVIKELFRGGVGIGGEVVRMPLELKARKRG